MAELSYIQKFDDLGDASGKLTAHQLTLVDVDHAESKDFVRIINKTVE